MEDIAALQAQAVEAGENVRLMKEANKATPGTHPKVRSWRVWLRAVVCLRFGSSLGCVW